VKDLFPENNQADLNFRFPEKYQVTMARTDCLRDSAVPYMQRLLNDDFLTRKKKRSKGNL
jgi:hypothetical protein